MKNRALSKPDKGILGALLLSEQFRNIYSNFKIQEQVRLNCTDVKVCKDDLKKQPGRRGSNSIILFVQNSLKRGSNRATVGIEFICSHMHRSFLKGSAWREMYKKLLIVLN